MGRSVLSNDPTRLSSGNEYATADDFRELFASDMVDLFNLAFLLTADAEKAEHCLLLTMQECMVTGSVFKWWLPVWTKNALMRNGIRIVTESPICPPRKISHDGAHSSTSGSKKRAINRLDESAVILQLSDFDRLVYVISLVEHYPTRDCATLMGRTTQEVVDARNRAVDRVAAFKQKRGRASHRSLPATLRKNIRGLMAHAGVFRLELRQHRDLCLDCNCERGVAGNASHVY
jgi:hypothetical protein